MLWNTYPSLVFRLAIAITVLMMAVLPTNVLASGSPVVLHTPSDYESCAPSDVVTTSGVPSSFIVRSIATIFYVLPDGSTQFAATTGWVETTGNLSLPIPYPPSDTWLTTDPSTGMRQVFVGVTARVYNADGVLKDKLSGKWKVSCFPG